jgi:hypothetical protein
MPIRPARGFCFYCGENRDLNSVEHVITTNFGGSLTIRVCRSCNQLANQEVDDHLAQCDHLSRIRSEAGISDSRNRLFEFREVLRHDDGMRLQATWTQHGIKAKILPVEISVAPGLSWVFVDSRDEDYERVAVKRAARDGLTRGPAVEVPPELLDGPESGDELKMLVRTAPCGHREWLWVSAAAKILLGCIAKAARNGAVPTDEHRTLLVAALRELAFRHTFIPELWAPEDLPLSPLRPSPVHPLAGRLSPSDHLVALHPPERAGQPPLGQVVLFGQLLLELPLPGLHLRSDVGWLFDAKQRRVIEAPLAELRTRSTAHPGQLSLAA